MAAGPFAALGGRSGDGWAHTAAVAGLVPWLTPIIGCWQQAGLAGQDLEAAEADLVAACYLALRDQPGPGPVDPGRVVQAGWHRAFNDRRTERARTTRQVRVNPDRVTATGAGRSSFETVLVELSKAVTAGRVPVSGAAALAWHTGAGREIARRAGITPEALRARRSRALRSLAGSGRWGRWLRCCRSG